MENLTDQQREGLRALMNSWAWKASVALSQMTSKNIEISLTKVGLYPIEDVPAKIGKPTDVSATVYLQLQGEKEGQVFPLATLLFMYSIQSGAQLAAMMQGTEVDQTQSKQELDEIEVSALKETGNILAGTCATVMGDFFGFKLLEGLPNYACDMMQAVIDNVLIELASKAEDTLLFDINFTIRDQKISSSFLILFDPFIRSQLIEKLSVKS